MDKRNTVSQARWVAPSCEDVSEGQLISWALEATSAVDGMIPISSRHDFKPVQMVTLLTYCYARGIFGSEEIESRLDEAAIAYICAGQKPDWHQLRRFRRVNIFVLVEAMAHLMRLLAGRARVTDADRNEARRRLQIAIQTDSMAMDQ